MFYKLLRAFLWICCIILFPLKVMSLEALPLRGPLLICCKHISLIDPVLIITHFRYEIYSLAKITLFKIKPFGAILTWMHAIPVSRNGVSAGFSAIDFSTRLLQDGHVMDVSPEGTRVRRNTDLHARTGAVVLARKTGTPILVCGLYTKDYHIRPFRRTELRVGNLLHYGDLCDPEDPDNYQYAAAQLMERIRILSEKDVSQFIFRKGIRYAERTESGASADSAC